MNIQNVDHYKKKKGCVSILTGTYKDFAENTSIHGLKYTVKSDISIYEKLFWMVVVFCGLCGSVYMTILFWERYTSNPTRTTILTSFAPTTVIPFPAVTICNINRILSSKIDKFVHELKLNEMESKLAHKALPQFLIFTNPRSIEYNMTELKMFQDILSRRGYTDIPLIMDRISQSCDDLFRKCFWNQKEVECMTLFSTSLSTDGICCSFNYKSIPKNINPHTSISGLMSGLFLVMDSQMESTQYSSLYSFGLKVIIHTSQDFPGNGAPYKVISKGRISYLQLVGTALRCSDGVKSLPIDQRKCVYPDEAKPLYFHEKYADTNCLTECEAKHFFEICNCVPFYYSFTEQPICNITSFPCLDFAISEKNKLNQVSKCSCETECEDYLYDLMLTSTNIQKTDGFINNLISEADFTPEQEILNIYFVSNTQQILLRDTITSTIYLLSSFGGVYSLFMGCSLMTIAEIFYYFVIRFLINMKLFGKIENPEVDNLKNYKNNKSNLDDFYTYKNDSNVFLH